MSIPSRAHPARSRIAASAAAALLILSCAAPVQPSVAPGPSRSAHATPADGTTPPVGESLPPATGDIHSIRHVVVIMQENRSFDQYFGTYPGANGIPMQNGVPTVCIPDTLTGECVRPYHSPKLVDTGGPHRFVSAIADIDGGKMDGFINQARLGAGQVCTDPFDPACEHGSAPLDVVGYKTAAQIPNYWAYARQFVLQDAMFEPTTSWSLPAHLFTVAAWSAKCTIAGDPMSCYNEPAHPESNPHCGTDEPRLRMDRHHVAAARGWCQLGVLRRGWDGTRLLER